MEVGNPIVRDSSGKEVGWIVLCLCNRFCTCLMLKPLPSNRL